MNRRLLRAVVLLLMPTPSPVLRQNDENLWRYCGAVMRVMRGVVHQAFTLLRPANNLTPKELLFALPGYSNAQYNRLGESVRQKLDDNVPTHEYDITLLYMLLQKVCGLSDEWSTPGTLQCSLKAMKDKRNQLAHEDLSLTRQELETRILELKALSRSVLEKTGQRVGQVVDDAIREMEAGMDEALTAAVDMWEPYRQGLQDLRQQQCSILVREGKKEMRALSERRRILNPFVWLLDGDFSKHTVDYVFTELTLQNRDAVNMSDLLQTTLPSGSLPDSVVISGTPGIGKTSLMRFILHEWVRGGGSAIQGLDAFELVLPVEARHVFSGSVTELVRCELLPNACRQVRQEDIVSSLQEVSLMWLLDGYDEASHTTKQVIKEILVKFPHSKVLITTRPECAHELLLAISESHRSHLPMRIIGFSGNNFEMCARKIFGLYISNDDEERESLESFLSFLRKREYEMQKVFHVPLYLTVLAVLWIDNPSVVSAASTGTRIFKILLEHIINKMVTREPFKKSGLRNRDLRQRLEAFLDTLGYAMCFHRDEMLFFHRFDDIEFLEDRCKELCLPFEETMAPFFTCIVETSTSGTKEFYYINHRTILEFLLARVLCRNMISERWDVLTSVEKFMKLKLSHLKKYRHEVPEHFQDFYSSFESPFRMCKILDDGEDWNEDTDDIHDTAYGYNRFCNCISGTETNVHRRAFSEALKILGLSGFNSYCINFVSGYLNVENELTQQRAEQIYYIYSISDTTEETWLSLVLEAEEDEYLLRELTPHLTNFPWNVNRYKDHAVKGLLKYVTPQSLLLQCSREEDIQYLTQNIQRFSEVPSELDIHFRNLYFDKGHETTDVLECLKTVLGESAKCTLASLCCPVDGGCLALLRRACHLRELLVKVNTLEDAKLLAEVTRELPRLEFLEVVFDPAIMAAGPRTLPSFDVFQARSKGKWKLSHQRRKKKVRPDEQRLSVDLVEFFCRKWRLPLPSFDVFQERGKGKWKLSHQRRKKKVRPDEQRLSVDLVEFFCRKWRLPSAHCKEVCSGREAPSCCVGCHHTPDSRLLLDKFNHFSARRWHQKCIRLLRVLTVIVEWVLSVSSGGKQSKQYKFNLYAREEDQDGLWWCRVFREVTRRLIRQHKHSVTVHYQLLRFTHTFRDRKETVPIKLVFTEAFTMNPKKFGASVAKLCPNPMQVVLLVEDEHMHPIRRTQTFLWTYFSLANIGALTCVKFERNYASVHLTSDFLDTFSQVSRIMPFVSWDSVAVHDLLKEDWYISRYR